MSPSRSRKSLLELYAEPFADLPPLAGIIAGAVLGLAGWVAPLFAGGSAMTGVWLQFGRWFLWLFAVAVLVYTGGGALRRAFDRKTFDATDDPAGLSWIQFERYVAEFYRRQGATVTPRGGSHCENSGGCCLMRMLTEPSSSRAARSRPMPSPSPPGNGWS